MATMTTTKTTKISTIQTFGEILLTTGDLDPLYIALHRAELGAQHLRRWLFAYWCCYNAGAASWISEQEDYWPTMQRMAANETPTPLGLRWPRGHERRHFRGAAAVKAVTSYQDRTPEAICAWIESAAPSFAEVRKRVLSLHLFGPWISFKVGDMLDRVAQVPMNFSEADVLMFDQPYNSALEVWSHFPGDEIARAMVSEKEAVKKTVWQLLQDFNNFLAPPTYDRRVNIQEIETILCKWKSHNNGSYPVGLDSRELRGGLHYWATVSPTARRLFDHAPNPPESGAASS